MQVHSSVTNQARRTQIVEATIEVVADEGFREATFQNIARTAGIRSTRTISYHFADKDDLIEAVVTHIYGLIREFMGASAARDEKPSPTSALEGYIRAAVGLTIRHRRPMTALMAIMLEHHPRSSEVYGEPQEKHVMSQVERILVDGQEAGEFGSFDPMIMATTIQRSVDGLPFLLRTYPDLDLEHYADELVATFSRAVGIAAGKESES